jgi:hypothetical protein
MPWCEEGAEVIRGTLVSTDAVLAAHDGFTEDVPDVEIRPGDVRECGGRWRAELVVLVPDSPNSCGGCECHTAPGHAHLSGHPCFELCERGIQWKWVVG